MNIKIIPLSFKAKYFIGQGRPTSATTAKNFDSVIDKLQHSRDLAVKAQRYMESPKTQQKIEALPQEDTVEFDNIRIYNEQINARELEHTLPKIIYTNGKNLKLLMNREECGEVTDIFRFRLDKNGNLNSAEADEWLNSKLNIIA